MISSDGGLVPVHVPASDHTWAGSWTILPDECVAMFGWEISRVLPTGSVQRAVTGRVEADGAGREFPTGNGGAGSIDFSAMYT